MLAACARDGGAGVQPTLHQAWFWRLVHIYSFNLHGSSVRFCPHLIGGKYPKTWIRKVCCTQEMLGKEVASRLVHLVNRQCWDRE